MTNHDATSVRDRHRWIVAGLLLTLTAASMPARADNREALLQQGIDLHFKAQFKRSVKVLRRALKGAQDDKLRARGYLYLGLNYAVLGQQRRAKAAIHRALRRDPQLSLDPDRVKTAHLELFRRVRKSMRGELSVTADRDGAKVFLDGAELGDAPLSRHVTIGVHRLEVRTADGRYRHRRSVSIAYNERTQVDAALALSTGRLSVRSDPAGALVSIDGSEGERTPLLHKQLPVGEHQLTVRMPGRKPQALRVTVAADDERAVTVTLPLAATPPPPGGADRPRRRIWTWVAAGGAVVTAGVAIGLGLSANADYDEYQTTTDPQRFRSLADSVPTKGVVATVFYGVAGALAISSVVLFVMEGRSAANREGNHEDAEPGDEERAEARALRFDPPAVVPTVSGGAAAVLSGRFW